MVGSRQTMLVAKSPESSQEVTLQCSSALATTKAGTMITKEKINSTYPKLLNLEGGKGEEGIKEISRA